MNQVLHQLGKTKHLSQPRRPQRPATSRAEKIDRLQVAAISVIAQGGISGASTRAIANEAGLNLAAVHYCFDGKDDLLTSLLERLLNQSRVLISSQGETAQSATSLLGAMASAYWHHAVKNPDIQRVNIELALYAVTHEEYGERARGQFNEFRAGVAALIQPFLPEWPKKDIAALASACVSSMEGLVLQYMVTRDKARCERALALSLSALQALCERGPGDIDPFPKTA